MMPNDDTPAPVTPAAVLAKAESVVDKIEELGGYGKQLIVRRKRLAVGVICDVYAEQDAAARALVREIRAASIHLCPACAKVLGAGADRLEAAMEGTP